MISMNMLWYGSLSPCRMNLRHRDSGELPTAGKIWKSHVQNGGQSEVRTEKMLSDVLLMSLVTMQHLELEKDSLFVLVELITAAI